MTPAINRRTGRIQTTSRGSSYRSGVRPRRTRDRSPRFWLVVVALACCLLGGGSSWESTLSLLYLRPVLVVLAAAFLAFPAERGKARLRVPALLLIAFAATIAIQLVPLPPAWWRALPGREPYWEAVRLVGEAELWRPISLSPDRTINSLLALLPAATVLIGAAGLARRELEDLVSVLLAMLLASAVLGAAQWSGTGYFYKQVSAGFPTGFLVNRNHQAVFLALAFPLLRAWLEVMRARDVQRPWHLYAALAAALFVIAVIVTTGSRAGLAATVAALALSIPMAPVAGRIRWSRAARRQAAAGAVVLIVLLGALVFFGRAVSVDRLTDADNYTAELRVRFTPLLVALVRGFGWAGSGFGTFDAVFRAGEPDWALKPTFFNRAHNEVLEVAITGGVAALAAVSAFLVWTARRTIAAWRHPEGMLARLGSIVALLLGLASLVDYPLRTPLLGAVFALGVVWLSIPAARARAKDAES